MKATRYFCQNEICAMTAMTCERAVHQYRTTRPAGAVSESDQPVSPAADPQSGPVAAAESGTPARTPAAAPARARSAGPAGPDAGPGRRPCRAGPAPQRTAGNTAHTDLELSGVSRRRTDADFI